MTKDRLVTIALQYLKVCVGVAIAVALIARVMLRFGAYGLAQAIAIGGYCTTIALLAIGVGATDEGSYGSNRRQRPGRLSPRFLCLTTAAALLLVSLFLDLVL